MYKLRNSPDTQVEVQMYAKAIGKLISEIYPLSWAALLNDGK